VGAVTVSGPGRLGLGVAGQGPQGLPDGSGSLNAGSGSPVTVSDGATLNSVGAGDATGPLAVRGGTLDVAQALAVKGAFSLDDATTLALPPVGGNAPVVSASGDVDLGGATLALTMSRQAGVSRCRRGRAP
jgi:hypothetical protein